MAKDIFHEAVREALEKEGWKITHDPYLLKDKKQKIDYEIDLGAQQLIEAEKGIEKIAVEIKTFAKASLPNEFHGILGQYLTYLEGLSEFEPERILYLAIPLFAHIKLLNHPFILRIIKKYQVKILVYNAQHKIIVSWEK
jgi:XisH protein